MHERTSKVRAALLGGLAVVSACAVAGCGGGGGDSTGPLNPDTTPLALANARADHTVTSLANTDLLVAGGTGALGLAIAAAEVIDASALGSGSNPVVTTGSMAFARTRHTATRLVSGNVLVVGGAPTTAVEEFVPVAPTPALGGFSTSPVAALATARSRHAAVRLLDGRVLIVGGEDMLGSALASCEVYAGALVPMAAATPLATARRDATATLLPDGRVLVVGGTNAVGLPLTSAEIYAPGTDTWSPAANTLSVARALHAAHFLDGANADPADDRVLIAGGAGAGGGGVATAEVFDPATNLFGPYGSLAGPGVFDAATAVLANGQLAIAGGFTAGGTTSPDEPVREALIVRLGASGGVGAQDIPARRGAARGGIVTSAGPTGSDLVVVGGYDQDGVVRAEVYVLAIDDATTALADTLSDEEALALAVFATEFHVFLDGATGIGDIDLRIEEDPVFGRYVTGHVGNFDVDLELDAGAAVGNVEGKRYVLTIDAGFVFAPDLEVDFRPSSHVDGDMDVSGQDFDFDMDRDPALFRGYVVGEDREAYARIEIDGDHTDADASFMDLYFLY